MNCSKNEGFVAVISLIELAYIYARNTNSETARLRVMQVQGSKLNIIPLTTEIAVVAGLLKQPGISVADAIIAATALSVDASAVTNDAHLSVMGVEVSTYP